MQISKPRGLCAYHFTGGQSRLFDRYRAGGLGAVGLRQTLEAITNGQVDELVLSASMKEIRGNDGEDTERFTADELVTRAAQTGAAVRFVEDPALLAAAGGVGCRVRIRERRKAKE